MEDNQETIQLGLINMASACSKHINLRHHVIWYHNDKGAILLVYIETDKMIADMLTKVLPRPGFQRMGAAVMTDQHVNVNDEHEWTQTYIRVGEGIRIIYSEIEFVIVYVWFNNIIPPPGCFPLNDLLGIDMAND